MSAEPAWVAWLGPFSEGCVVALGSPLQMVIFFGGAAVPRDSATWSSFRVAGSLVGAPVGSTGRLLLVFQSDGRWVGAVGVPAPRPKPGSAGSSPCGAVAWSEAKEVGVLLLLWSISIGLLALPFLGSLMVRGWRWRDVAAVICSLLSAAAASRCPYSERLFLLANSPCRRRIFSWRERLTGGGAAGLLARVP